MLFQLTESVIILFRIFFLLLRSITLSRGLRVEHGICQSNLIESVAYCYQILLVPFYTNSTQKTSVNWIIRLILHVSLLCWPKVILLSGGHCINKLHVHFFSCYTKGFLLESSSTCYDRPVRPVWFGDNLQRPKF